MRTTLVLLVAICGLSCCFAQIPGLGHCPDMATKENFEPAKYVGKWYEAERYFAFYEFSTKCASATYNVGEHGDITVFNKGIGSWSGKQFNITGVAVSDPTNPAKLAVTFPGTKAAPYWVVDTDYENYAVVWSCVSFGFVDAKFSWILTREQQPMLGVMQNAYDVIQKNGISKFLYMKTDQKDCPAGY